MNNATNQFPLRKPKCFTFTRTRQAGVIGEPLFVIYASLIPLIVGANLLSIFGIIKTKRRNFTSSQILFLTLFLSDITIGAVQIPIQIYVKWGSSNPSCFQIQLNAFLRAFPVSMSGTILCVISVDRYINVVYNAFHKRIVTNKLLAFIFILVALISAMWSTLDATLKTETHITKAAHLYIALSAYTGTILVTGVVCNVALLRNVKQKTQHSYVQQALDARFTNTIAIIVFVMVTAYLPLLIAFSFAGYALNHPSDKKSIREKGTNVLWTMISPQINAVLNSVIYVARSSRMKRYYYKLFNCETEKRISAIGDQQQRAAEGVL